MGQFETKTIWEIYVSEKFSLFIVGSTNLVLLNVLISPHSRCDRALQRVAICRLQSSTPTTNKQKRNPRPYINPRDSLVSGGCETELILLTKILLVNLPQNGMATGEGEVTQRLCIFWLSLGL